MTRYLTLAIALLLAVPAHAEPVTYEAGCDDNWCWPRYTLTRPTMDVYLDDVQYVCGRGKYACAIVTSGPICRRVLPNVAPEGTTMLELEAHEGWHCMGHHHEGELS